MIRHLPQKSSLTPLFKRGGILPFVKGGKEGFLFWCLRYHGLTHKRKTRGQHFTRNLEGVCNVNRFFIYNELGIELRQKGMFAEAIMNYGKAISIDPEDEVLYFNLARAHLEQGHRENAAGYLKTALRLKPDFPEAQELFFAISAAVPQGNGSGPSPQSP